MKIIILPDQLYYNFGDLFKLNENEKIEVTLLKESRYFAKDICGAKLMYLALGMEEYKKWLKTRNSSIIVEIKYGKLETEINKMGKEIRMFTPNSIYDYSSSVLKKVRFYEPDDAFLVNDELLMKFANNPPSMKKQFAILREKYLPRLKISKSYDKESQKSAKTIQKNKKKTIIRKFKKPSNFSSLKAEINRKVNPFVKNYEAALYFPWERQSALSRLNTFVSDVLPHFGPWQDAYAKDEPFLYHSVLSAAINCGILGPKEIIEKCAGEKGIPMSSLEPYLRQIMGWREYIRVNYHVERGYLRFLKRKPNKLANYWYPFNRENGPLGFVNKAVEWVGEYAYLHHIIRLMYTGIVMKMSGISPQDSYGWFLGMFIDAYPWVMAPNVFGMVYSLTGLMRRQYLMSANYVKKMSDFDLSKEEEKIMDTLYWGYMAKNRNSLKKDYIYSSQLKFLNKRKEFVDNYDKIKKILN